MAKNEFKDYKRKLILISPHTAILLHIFKKDLDHQFEEIELDDMPGYAEGNYTVYEEAAQQFIKQFEGHECPHFVEKLRDECNKYLDNWHKEIENINKKRNESSSNQ